MREDEIDEKDYKLEKETWSKKIELNEILHRCWRFIWLEYQIVGTRKIDVVDVTTLKRM